MIVQPIPIDAMAVLLDALNASDPERAARDLPAAVRRKVEIAAEFARLQDRPEANALVPFEMGDRMNWRFDSFLEDRKRQMEKNPSLAQDQSDRDSSKRRVKRWVKRLMREGRTLEQTAQEVGLKPTTLLELLARPTHYRVPPAAMAEILRIAPVPRQAQRGELAVVRTVLGPLTGRPIMFYEVQREIVRLANAGESTRRISAILAERGITVDASTLGRFLRGPLYMEKPERLAARKAKMRPHPRATFPAKRIHQLLKELGAEIEFTQGWDAAAGKLLGITTSVLRKYLYGKAVSVAPETLARAVESVGLDPAFFEDEDEAALDRSFREYLVERPSSGGVASDTDAPATTWGSACESATAA